MQEDYSEYRVLIATKAEQKNSAPGFATSKEKIAIVFEEIMNRSHEVAFFTNACDMGLDGKNLKQFNHALTLYLNKGGKINILMNDFYQENLEENSFLQSVKTFSEIERFNQNIDVKTTMAPDPQQFFLGRRHAVNYVVGDKNSYMVVTTEQPRAEFCFENEQRAKEILIDFDRQFKTASPVEFIQKLKL